MSSREGPIAAQRARNARLAEQAAVFAAHDAARHTQGARPRVTDTPSATTSALPVILLPANTRNTEPLPDDRRDAFLDGLRERLAATFVDAVRDDTAPMSGEARAAMDDAAPPQVAGDALPDAARTTRDALLGAACATCRGECCTAGGTHAFLRHDSLVRVRAYLARDGAAVDAEQIEAEYARHLPVRHYRGSCVYHTPTGCALPRTLRSNLCNRYLCGGLTQLARALDASGGNSAYVAAADSVHLRRVAKLGPDGARTVARPDRESLATTPRP
jgi:hypothetical protein